MKQVILHRIVAAPVGAAGTDRSFSGTTIKLGLDIHQACHVVAAQEDHATPRPARRFAPEEFVPWVETLLAKGHHVFVVYEACGFGFGLCRRLQALGATCYTIFRK
jgi:transposase